MLKRHSSASGNPFSSASSTSEGRRTSYKQARLKSWWLRGLLLLVTGVIGWQAWRLLAAGHQLDPYISQISHETVHWSWRKPTCPLEYKRHQWTDIQAGRKRPYLFGGQQEPECTNCEVDKLWSHFCQFKSHVSCFALSCIRPILRCIYVSASQPRSGLQPTAPAPPCLSELECYI